MHKKIFDEFDGVLLANLRAVKALLDFKLNPLSDKDKKDRETLVGTLTELDIECARDNNDADETLKDVYEHGLVGYREMSLGDLKDLYEEQYDKPFEGENK